MSRDAKKSKKGTGILDEQEGSSSVVVRIEPFVDFEEDLSAPPRAVIETQLEEQIDSLKPQVENIAQTADLQNLSSDQVDILKRYITLKETEVKDLKEIVGQYQTFMKKLNRQTKNQADRNQQLLVDFENIRVREEALRIENRDLKERFQQDVGRMRQDFEDKLNRAGHYEIEMESIKRSREEWREKIKEDLKRIKLKERELENKYELLKRDTQALLDSKDKHVLELKRKNDALELELETFEERLQKLNTILQSVDGKKTRLIETMKLALALLEEIDKTSEGQD